MSRGVTIRVALISALLAGTAFPSGRASEPTPTAVRTATCAFSNPAYSGWCRVVETIPEKSSAGAVCQQAFRCLNDVRCTKTYCNATTIRGGWRLEAVKVEGKKK